MNPRGHRGFAAVLMLLVLVLSAMALLPARAQAATNQVTGLVSQCNSVGQFVGGATVTLVDANGFLPPLTTTTGTDGTFSFTPSAANYTIAVTAPGYYSGGVSTPFRFDGASTVSEDFCLTHQLPAGKTGFVVTFHVQDSSTSASIGGATVSVYNVTRQSTGQSALISTSISNTTTGLTGVSLWADTFNVQVNATGYGPFIEPMTISSAGTINLGMTTQFTVVGHARNSLLQFVSAGLTATLYNLGVPSYNGTKVIPATVSGSLYTFHAPAGSYRMVVDADGYTAYVNPSLTLSGTPTTVSADATLSPSPQESYLTTVLFGTQNWNTLIIYRNWTLHPDSTVPGLRPAGFRDLRQEINFTFGSGLGNGAVSTNDITAFTAWLAHNGPLYVTTDSFFLLNGKSYNSSMTSYRILSVTGLPTAGANVQINTVATYSLKSTATITYGQPKYFLNMTLYPDTNTTVYHNETYIVQLPRAYEMASDTILPSTTPPAITTYNYTRITVDPGLVGTGITPQIRMVLQQSLNGTARAKVTGPSGKFYVVNSTYQNYQAYIAENANITFSAADSTDPVGDITKANFTWKFESNTNPAVKGYGITSVYNYTSKAQYTVNLTVVQGGGNITYRDITVWVDGMPPTADFRTNVTGPGSAIGLTLKINESTAVKFDGSLSSDLAYAGQSGIIPNSGYAWDFNGDYITDATGRIANWTFTKPGLFTVHLNVTDGVGWKASASMTVQVNDTQAPVPGFVVLDPANDYAPVTTLVEARNYTFNASTTTDNYDKLSALQFTWTIVGPIYQRQGTNNTFTGENITIGWTSWNLSYAVTLSVNDTGFGIGKSNTGTHAFSEPVNIDWTLHPDLYVNVGTIKASNGAPESGQAITITLNVTNKANRGAATHVYVTVGETGEGQSVTLMNQASVGSGWSMTDKNGVAVANGAIPSGSTMKIAITVTVVGQGNKTLTVTVADTQEPYTAITSENTATQQIIVNQPAWVTYAIVAAIVGVFLVVIGAMYYRRKVKAGDWQPRFRRAKGGKEEGGKEKPRKEKEVKEEKKRL